MKVDLSCSMWQWHGQRVILTMPFVQSISRLWHSKHKKPKMKGFFPRLVTSAVTFSWCPWNSTTISVECVMLLAELRVLSMLYTGMGFRDSEFEMRFVAVESSSSTISSTVRFLYWFCPFTHPNTCVGAKLFLLTWQQGFRNLWTRCKPRPVTFLVWKRSSRDLFPCCPCWCFYPHPRR